MKKLHSVSAEDMSDLKEYIFTVILDKYVTFETAFLNIKSDEKNRYLTYDDLEDFLDMCGLEVEKKHFDALILELDPVNY